MEHFTNISSGSTPFQILPKIIFFIFQTKSFCGSQIKILKIKITKKNKNRKGRKLKLMEESWFQAIFITLFWPYFGEYF